MENKSKVSRRNLFKWSLGAASVMATRTSVASVCGVQTGKQDLGPFFPQPNSPVDPIKENSDGSVPIFLSNDNDLTRVKGRNGTASGQQVIVYGSVTDAKCQPLAGATIIVWQASESGRYNHKGDSDNTDFKDPRNGQIIQRKLDPFFQSWGQTTTDENGKYEFKTIVPGFYPANLQSGWYRPPHIHFMISATGHPQFVTQMYFRGNEIKDNDFIQELNHKDFILQSEKLSTQQSEDLIVDFERKESGNELMGEFNIKLNAI